MRKPESLLVISIVIPIHNREKELEQTLQSIADQTYRPIELILVDNNSQDKSLEICQKFKNTNNDLFSQIEIIQELKKGANAARNAGLKKATGDYVLFFDSDDLMYTDCIESIATHLIIEKWPQAVAFSFYIRFPDGTLAKRPHIFSSKPSDQLFTTIIPTHGICIKRTLFDEIGLWDEDLQRWQDLEFGFRALLHIHDLKWLTAKPLYEVNDHEDSISGNSYLTDHEILNESLSKISVSIEKQPEGKAKDKLKRALSYKIGTLASQIRKEGHAELGDDYLKKAISNLPRSRKNLSVCLLRFQYGYEGNGGRGFWRLARLLL